MDLRKAFPIKESRDRVGGHQELFTGLFVMSGKELKETGKLLVCGIAAVHCILVKICCHSFIIHVIRCDIGSV